MTAAAAKPLVVISSRTGNTMILGHAICDAMPGAVPVSYTHLTLPTILLV